MKLKFLSLIILLCSVFYACKDQEKNQYLEELEQMKNTLDSLQTVNFDSLQLKSKEIINSVSQTMFKLKENYRDDTLDFDFVQRLDIYKEIEKKLLINSGNLAKIRNAIPESKQKINDLRHDIKNGTNNRDKYREYIDFEADKIKNIQSIYNYYLKTLTISNLEFDTLQPYFEQYKESFSVTITDEK